MRHTFTCPNGHRHDQDDAFGGVENPSLPAGHADVPCPTCGTNVPAATEAAATDDTDDDPDNTAPVSSWPQPPSL